LEHHLEALLEVRRETRSERRAVDHEGLERLAFFVDGGRPDADLLSVHLDYVPAFFRLWGVLVLYALSAHAPQI